MPDIFKVQYCNSVLIERELLEAYAETLQKFIHSPYALRF